MGTSIGVTLNLIILFYFIQTKFVKLDLRLISIRCLQILFASTTMGFFAYESLGLVQDRWGGFRGKALEALIPIMIGMLVYILILAMFKIPEANLLREKLFRRFGRKS